MNFNGNITIDGGITPSASSSGQGGDAGTLILNTSNALTVNGNILARGGTGRSDTCDTAASYGGSRGRGGTINVLSSSAITLNGNITANRGTVGFCNNGQGGNVYINSSSILNISSTIWSSGNSTGNITLAGKELHVTGILNVTNETQSNSGVNGSIKLFYNTTINLGGVNYNGEIGRITGDGFSITDDSLVALADGSKKKIKDIKEGDFVLSLDENSGKIVSRKVNALLDHGIKQIYEM